MARRLPARRRPAGPRGKQAFQLGVLPMLVLVNKLPEAGKGRRTLCALAVTDDGADPGQVPKFRDAGVQVEVATVTR